MRASIIPLAAALALASCRHDAPVPPASPDPSITSVRFAYLAATALRSDLPPDAQACARAVGRTHIHPSWRNFATVPLTAVGSDRWEITFTDVPVGVRQSIRVSDGNVCVENPTGAATRSVFANDVRLVEIVTTPGSGPEPGLAFTVDARGRVTP